MRVELQDFMGQGHVIESYNSETIAAWFKDRLPVILSADAWLPDWQLRIIPTSPEEKPGGWGPRVLNKAAFRDLGWYFLGLAGEQESRLGAS